MLIVVVALRLAAVSYNEGVSKPIVNFSHCHGNSLKQVRLTPLSSLEVGCDHRRQAVVDSPLCSPLPSVAVVIDGAYSRSSSFSLVSSSSLSF